jgi:hypothetical protein
VTDSKEKSILNEGIRGRGVKRDKRKSLKEGTKVSIIIRVGSFSLNAIGLLLRGN